MTREIETDADGLIRLQKLLARGLIEESGHDVDSGAVVFATTSHFLERMGLRSLDDLPALAPHLPEAETLEAELGQLAITSAAGAHTRSDLDEHEPDRTVTAGVGTTQDRAEDIT